MLSPEVSCGVLLNELVVVTSTNVVHFTQIHCPWGGPMNQKKLGRDSASFDALGVTVNTRSASKRLRGTFSCPKHSQFHEN